MEKLILTGDCDQALYEWSGAKADLGLDPEIPLTTLKNSYRVSYAVHAFSEEIINLIPSDQRLQRQYHPTEEQGEVLSLEGDYRHPERWFDIAQKHLDRFETVQIHCSCSYMISPIIKFLRQESVPFANSYRRQRRDWNPLVHSKKVVTAAMRAQNYFAGWRRTPVQWTAGEMNLWLPLASKILKRGGKERLAKVQPDALVGLDLLGELMPLEAMLATGPEFLLDHLSAAYQQVDYQIRVGINGWADLEIEPALQVGTIHSFKGSESDAVIIFPDLSPEAAKAVRRGEIGPTARMFFVGATRARTSLYLGRPANQGMYLRFPR